MNGGSVTLGQNFEGVHKSDTDLSGRLSAVMDELLLLFCVLVGGILVYNNARSRRAKLGRSGLLWPQQAPWVKLYRHGDDGSFLNLTGFSKSAFVILNKIVFPENDNGIMKRGRRSLLKPCDRLGLYLMYVNSRMEMKNLCLIFGVTPSTCSSTIDAMRERVVYYLKRHPLARVKFPKQAEMRILADRVQLREPTVDNVIGFVDGVSLSCQCSEAAEKQAEAYNGYHHDTRCNNVLAFSSFGKIIYACINYPGSWHDANVVLALANKVINCLDPYALCVDKGFPRSGELFDRFVGPFSKKSIRKLSPIVRNELIARANVYTSLRQASEWGMRALQGTFGRLTTRLTFDSAKRHDLILSIILLHNIRTELIGLNQIATVFNPEYEQYINLEGYDRIARYFYNDNGSEDSDNT